MICICIYIFVYIYLYLYLTFCMCLSIFCSISLSLSPSLSLSIYLSIYLTLLWLPSANLCRRVSFLTLWYRTTVKSDIRKVRNPGYEVAAPKPRIWANQKSSLKNLSPWTWFKSIGEKWLILFLFLWRFVTFNNNDNNNSNDDDDNNNNNNNLSWTPIMYLKRYLVASRTPYSHNNISDAW